MKGFPVFLLALTLLSAQSIREVELTAEPHHHLVFENSSVRVFLVEVPPHTDSLMHWHRHDYSYVMLAPAEVANVVNGKAPVTFHLAEGETNFTSAPFAHIARNIGDQPFRNLTIEILNDATLRHSTAQWDEDRGVNVLHGGTEQILFVKDGIRVTEFELQPGGVVPMHHYAGPHLLVAVSDLDFREKWPIDVHPQDVGRLKSGDCKWLPGNYSHSITNIGTHPAKFVTLEFPKK